MLGLEASACVLWPVAKGGGFGASGFRFSAKLSSIFPRMWPIPVYLWFCGKNITLDSANDARLVDGETELSLVA